MIVDFQRFLRNGRPRWEQLDKQLQLMERLGGGDLALGDALTFHGLYEQTCSDLARLQSLPGEHELRVYLESLVARAYQYIHEPARREKRFTLRGWVLGTLPRTFRRRARYFYVALAATVLGGLVGAAVIRINPENRRLIFPPQFGHLYDSPSERVDREVAVQSGEIDLMDGNQGTFSAQLMTHNTRVAIFTMALGMIWGIPTLVMLFYNGAILGAVIADYAIAGEGLFLAGWLLPHGSVEIPAILLGGQAGLLLGVALLGWGRADRWRDRMREVLPDVMTLITGGGLLLIWAGLVEAFFSQYHEPVLPYAIKVAAGGGQLILLCAYLAWAGRKSDPLGEESMRNERFRTLRVATPEGIVFTQRLAGPFSRFCAWIIDIVAIGLLVTILLAVLRSVGWLSPDLYNLVAIITLFGVMIGYGIVFEWKMQGQTPGKWVCGLRVIDERGLRLHMPQVVIRNLLRAVDGFPFGYAIGGMVALIHPRGQRLGDLAAGTLVVAPPRGTAPDVEALVGDRHNSFRTLPHLEGRLRQVLTPEESTLLMDAVLRRNQLDPQARLALYREMATAIRPIVGFPEEMLAELSDEQFLRNVVDSLFRRPQMDKLSEP